MNTHDKEREDVRDEAVVAEAAVEERQEQDPASPVQLKGAWKTFVSVWETWKGHWKIFTGIEVVWAAAMLACLIIGGLVAGVVFGISVSDVPSGGMVSFQTFVDGMKARPALVAVAAIVGIALAAVMALVSAWSSIAVFKAWEWVMREERESMSVRNAYAATWNVLPRYIWASILGIALICVGFLALAIPGILLAIAFTLMAPIMMAENVKGVDALKRTARLATPHLFTIFWRTLLAGIVLYLPAQMLASLIDAMADGVGSSLNQLWGLVAAPVMSGVVYATYLDAKAVRKEGSETGVTIMKVALFGGLAALAIIVIALAA
jgi:hypothetical protein